LRDGAEWATFGDVDVAELIAENAERRREVAELQSGLTDAQARIRLLEERLGQDSTNSSKPPSTDGPAVKRPPRARKTGRRRGAQPGHQGRARSLVPIDEVDEVIDCVPTSCAACGSERLEEDPNPERHQVVDIPEPVTMRPVGGRPRTAPGCG
jgi:transposase